MEDYILCSSIEEFKAGDLVFFEEETFDEDRHAIAANEAYTVKSYEDGRVSVISYISQSTHTVIEEAVVRHYRVLTNSNPVKSLNVNLKETVYQFLVDIVTGVYDKTDILRYDPKITGEGVSIWRMSEQFSYIDPKDLAIILISLMGEDRVQMINNEGIAIPSFLPIIKTESDEHIRTDS